MKRFMFIMLVAFSFNCFSQNTYIYDGHGNIIGGSQIQTVPGSNVTLIDSVNSTRFILDSAHIYITAIDAKGDTLWRVDPWKDDSLPIYRVKRPVIVQFRFRTLKIDNSQIIYIVYNNTQYGTLNKATGNFDWMGQD